MKSRILLLSAAVLLAAAAALGQELTGQSAPTPPAPARTEARQIDFFGKIGHCDWTARLDNLAIELQNNPSAKSYLISYNAPGRHSYAPRQLSEARFYLREARGIEASRIVLIEGGTREELKEGQTELWLVPEGAAPPASEPVDGRYSQHFSGKFDTFTTDPNVYEEIYEMGTPSSIVARIEFAAKLKQQPYSIGYIIVREPKGAAPGAWRLQARREEQLLKERGVEPSRLKALAGGRGEGREVEIEFWLLPPGAPPPEAAAAAGKAAEPVNAAVKLHTYETTAPEVDENTERWMLENLAEFLRENPRATALLVAREPQPEEELEGAGEAASGAEPEAAPTPEAQTEPAEADASEAPAEQEEEAEILTMKELAEVWKSELISKYGVDPARVAVSEGRLTRQYEGRINLWVVPEKGKRPDPSAMDEDEIEREKQEAKEASGAERGADTAPPPAQPR